MVVEVILYSAWFGLVCPGRGEQFYLFQRMYHSKAVLACSTLAAMPDGWPTPGCSNVLSPLPCHFILQMSCLTFSPTLRWWQSHLIAPSETPLATLLCDSASRKPAPRKADAKMRLCRAAELPSSSFPAAPAVASCLRITKCFVCVHVLAGAR